MKNNVLMTVILVVVVGVGGFFAGMKYQQSKQPSRADFQAMRGMREGTPGSQRPAGLGAVRGEIIDKDEASMIVKLSDESSKIVLFSDNTEFNKAAKGSIDDLEIGQQVMVFGQENADKSVTAQTIQLNPAFGGRFREPIE